MTARDPSTDEIPATPVASAPEQTRQPEPETEGFALFDPAEAQQLRTRWEAVQGTFVDDPRGAVHSADQLVAQMIQSMTRSFAAHRDDVGGQLAADGGNGPETEDLRLALRRYRTLFNQLLNA